jgi:hypothetical protein
MLLVTRKETAISLLLSLLLPIQGRNTLDDVYIR